MEIIDGVHAIDTLGVGRAYVYAEADRLTLIDTGLAGSADRIFAEIEAIGRKPEDVAQVFVTHSHNDHAGSLADIVERCGAQVLAHSLDAHVIRGDEPPARANLRGPMRLLAPLVNRGLQPTAPVAIDRVVADGDEVDIGGGARVLHTPGHTPGSVALYLPQRRILFSGDAAANAMGLGPPSGPFGMFNADREQARESFLKLAELDFDVACFGHGKPLDREASLAFKRAAEKLG